MMRNRSALIYLPVLLVLAGCVVPPPPPPAPSADQSLGEVAQYIAADFASQLATTGTGLTLVIDPILDRSTGQQTVLSQELQSELTPVLESSIRGVRVVPFDQEGATNAKYVLTATVASVSTTGQYNVSASLTDRASGLVVAQSAARFVKKDADGTPTKFYDDSPSLVSDRSVQGYVKTSETSRGEAADALYVSQIPTAGLLSQALTAYNDEKWQEALDAYVAASARPDGQQLRTFNGVYLSNIRLGRTAQAAEAFGRIAALGLATNNLSVKLLFKPGSSSEFWPGKDLAGVYPMWLREIAKAAEKTTTCLSVVGHTSKSGTDAINNRLSLARAETVKQLLTKEVSSLSSKLSAKGVGSSQNIIGSGSDDAGDAVDRRVEFKAVACGG